MRPVESNAVHDKHQFEDSTFRLVWNNLAYAQLWEELKSIDEQAEWMGHKLQVIEGKPPHKLSNDEGNEGINENGVEYVIPMEMSQYKAGILTFQCLDLIFDRLCPSNAKRLTLALASSDGTVMFYFVYKGIHKPKRN